MNEAQTQAAAENEIIGGLLHDRSFLVETASMLPHHFTSVINQKAFSLIQSDPTMDSEIALRIALPDIEDTHISGFQKATLKRTNVIRAVAYLQKSWHRREARKVLRDALAQLDETADPLITTSRTARLLDQIDGVHADATTAQMSAIRIRDRTQEKRKPIETGVAPLDFVLHGGLHRGALIAILARYKVGKTIMQATLAHNLSSRGIPTLLISLERRADDAEQFIIAKCLNVDAAELGTEISPQLRPLLDDYVTVERPLWYVHKPGITTDELRARILSEVRQHNIQVVLIDHWQLIKGQSQKGSNREQEQSDSAQMVADLAAELDIAAVLTGQLNDNGAPRGSEGLLASAAIAVRLNRPDNGEDAFLDTLVCNRGRARVSGTPSDPSLTLDPAGPHYRAIDK